MLDTVNSRRPQAEKRRNTEGNRTMHRIAIAAALTGALLALPFVAAAQDATIGEREYMNSCAQCHGPDGTGGGVMAGYLTGSLPDLTQLQAGNDGVFPVARLYEVIAGTDTASIHGTSEMPAWGRRYDAQAPQMLGDMFTPADQEAFVRGRILALVEYISTLQAE